MTQTEREKYRAALVQLQARLRGEASHLTQEALGAREETFSNAPADSADLGMDLVAQERAISLLQNEEHVLEEIADALDRMSQGTFGLCEECGASVPKGRLRALPYVRHCVDCARKHQQSH